ncbi:MAG TPA: DUF4139 domain-containing protein, partial [Desulfobacterales bacterium]|nr:DUF4139 domain-containing protein [Desulfobacterales bacterium]
MKPISFILFVVALLVSSTMEAGQTGSRSTVGDQVAVEVTVYNNNLGLIKDTRKVALPV